LRLTEEDDSGVRCKNLQILSIEISAELIGPTVQNINTALKSVPVEDYSSLPGTHQ